MIFNTMNRSLNIELFQKLGRLFLMGKLWPFITLHISQLSKHIEAISHFSIDEYIDDMLMLTNHTCQESETKI